MTISTREKFISEWKEKNPRPTHNKAKLIIDGDRLEEITVGNTIAETVDEFANGIMQAINKLGDELVHIIYMGYRRSDRDYDQEAGFYVYGEWREDETVWNSKAITAWYDSEEYNTIILNARKENLERDIAKLKRELESLK